MPKPHTAACWTSDGGRCQTQSSCMLILRIWRSSSALSSQYTDHPDQPSSLSCQRTERIIMENGVNTSVLFLQILHSQQRSSVPDPLHTTRQLQPHSAWKNSTKPSSRLAQERTLVRTGSLHKSIRVQDQWRLTHSTTSYAVYGRKRDCHGICHTIFPLQKTRIVNLTIAIIDAEFSYLLLARSLRT